MDVSSDRLSLRAGTAVLCGDFVCVCGERVDAPQEEDGKQEGKEESKAVVASSGSGTFVLEDEIRASWLGTVQYSATGVCSIVPARLEKENGSRLPEVGDRITGRVTRITPRVAKVEVLCVGTSVLLQSVSAVIRVRDVRALDVDDVKMRDCFRPGDVVCARVLSLGDARSYYLTTASNELGVLIAKSAAGYHMVPVAWDKMECPVTRVKEARKVAKVVPSSASSSSSSS